MGSAVLLSSTISKPGHTLIHCAQDFASPYHSKLDLACQLRTFLPIGMGW